MTPFCIATGGPCTPATPCPLHDAWAAWTALSPDEQDAWFAAALGPPSSASSDPPPGPPSPELLAAVANCPDRGGVLPVSEQPECGCGGELSECRAGRGATPGRVTLADCLACRREATGLG